MVKQRAAEPARQLRVGELAERTGVPTATLRSWEARHGFPTPLRVDGGHRRYGDEQVALVDEVVRLRTSGLSVSAAIARTTEATVERPSSFFAALRSADQGLRTHILGKRALSAVPSAIEDECLAQARRPVLIGAVQQARFYRQSEVRWHELDRTAERTVVFADFEEDGCVEGQPREIALAADSPVRREWVLVCDSPGFAACVAGWELPSVPGTADSDRRFETVWTLDPVAVREATGVGIALVRESDPELSNTLAASLSGTAGAASPDLRRATALFGRIVEYAQAAAGSQALAS